MRKKYFVFSLILIIMVGLSSCSSAFGRIPQSELFEIKKEDVHILADNFCVKDGVNYEDKTLLESTDFIGFDCWVDKEQADLVEVYFKLTTEGQQKIADGTKKFEEASGFLSVWIGEELLGTPKVMEPITSDGFVLTLCIDNIQSLIEKMEGKTDQ
ncbi:hypothetical protein [Anaerovorax sp. IOR16]|uniref:hypothetical protein n=1 Tax=Anaerovorax sp. IOR16 TaxID=2773458 RepID=UPI0019D282E7|nr:hypothetical protein [Anaerovorax sp. IOR16]